MVYDPVLKFKPRYLYEDLSVGYPGSSKKRVIGIEVIPGNWTENGKSRFMSIDNMATVTPITGKGQGFHLYFLDPEYDEETSYQGTWDNGQFLWNRESLSDLYKTPVDGLVKKYPVALEVEGQRDEEGGLVVDEKGRIEFKIGSQLPLKKEDREDGIYFLSDSELYDDGKKYDEFYSMAYKYLKLPLGIQGKTTKYWNNGMCKTNSRGHFGPNKTMPLPFLRNGKPNPIFSQDGTFTVEVDGKICTDFISKFVPSNQEYLDLELASEYPYPVAALVCKKFNAGVESLTGKWYLPTARELIFVGIHRNKLNELMPKNGSLLQSNEILVSSQLCNGWWGQSPLYMDLSNNGIKYDIDRSASHYFDKAELLSDNGTYRVRAFIQIYAPLNNKTN